MDNYLEKILARQEWNLGEEQSGRVLEKLKEGIHSSVGNRVEPVSAEGLRKEAEQYYASEQKRNTALSQMVVQLSEILREDTIRRIPVSGTENTEGSSDWSCYEFLPAEQRQETPHGQIHLSMDAVSRFFERDARRYPG